MYFLNRNYNRDYFSWLFLITLLVSITPLFQAPVKLLILTLLIIFHTSKIKKTTALLISILVLYITLLEIILFVTYSPDKFSFTFLLFISSISWGFLLANYKSKYKKESLYSIEKTIFILSTISLLFHIAVQINPSLLIFSYKYTYGDFYGYTFFVVNILSDGDFNIINRFVGLASEPALWQFVLNFGLYLRLKLYPKPGFLVTLYALYIYLTYSTLGYLVLALQIAFFIRKSWVVLLFILIFISQNFTDIVTSNTANKLFSHVYFTNRYEASINAYKASLDYPFGMGTSYYDQLYKVMEVGGHDSFSQILIRYGFISALFFIVLNLLSIYRNIKLGVILLATSLTQTSWFLPIFVFLYIKILDKKI